MAEAIFLDEKTRSAEEIRHGLALASADLDEDLPVCRQQPRGTRGDAPIGVEPVGAAIERYMGIMDANLCRFNSFSSTPRTPKRKLE